MNNLKMFCLSLHDEHLENLKKINYIPVGLGSEYFRKEWLKDNTGENISHKNKFYAEYTFHYWFWKNMVDEILDDSWIGFCAYRRYWAKNDNLKHKELNFIVNNSNFNELILQEPSAAWNNYETILVEKIPLGKIKLSKIIKNGDIKSLFYNIKNIFFKNHNIKFHFDIFHGYGKIEKAISLLDKKEREDFTKFIFENNSFSRENMFICKSKKIIKDYYKSVFKWLNSCENLFGFNLKKWNEIRIYAFLAERYLPYWFNKYSKTREWPFLFYDTHKNSLKI